MKDAGTVQSYGKKKHPLGFYQVSPMPTQDELEKYYKEKYYQQCTSVTYSPDYTPAEKDYFRNRALLSEIVWRSFGGTEPASVIDVGCGEGFFAGYFGEKGWRVEACDFSVFGVQKHNPSLLPSFTQGNIYRILDEKIAAGVRYDFVNLSNVLEHVREPLELLDRLKAIMGEKSLLRIQVPNDFSPFQELLTQRKLTGETWFSPPDHLNYFTFESIKKVHEDRGFRVVSLLADFPIEMYLYNPHSNYWTDRKKGRDAHECRVDIDNFLVKQGAENYLRYLSAAAECGFGRSAVIFAAKA